MKSENGTVFHTCNNSFFPEGEVSENSTSRARRSPLCVAPGEETRFKPTVHCHDLPTQ
jgi:hypothetical protein